MTRERPLAEELRQLRERVRAIEQERDALRAERDTVSGRLKDFERVLDRLRGATQEEAEQRWAFERRIKSAEAELHGAKLR